MQCHNFPDEMVNDKCWKTHLGESFFNIAFANVTASPSIKLMNTFCFGYLARILKNAVMLGGVSL